MTATPTAEWAATRELLNPRAIPTKTPALSAHVAHVLETESPLHAWTYHRRLGGKPKPPTSPMELGTIMHNLLLEGGNRVVELPYDAYRSNEAKAEKAKVLALDLLPVLSEKLVEAKTCVERWRERLQSIRILGEPFDFSGGVSEVPLEWTEDGVLCHGRPDWLRKDRALIVDWKTTEGNNAPETCAAALLRSAGVIQDHAYRTAVEIEHPELAGRVQCVFLFAQIVEPFAVTPITCAASMREIGSGRWRRARETWERCLRTNTWPSYATSPVAVEAPAWALHREMNQGEWI